MTAFGADRAADVAAQCQAASEDIGKAFSVAFGGEFLPQIGEPTKLNAASLNEQFSDAGLIFRITIGDTQCLLVLAQSESLLPEWCSEPDGDGGSKLNELGRALAAAMLPPDVKHDLASVSYHQDLASELVASHKIDSPTGLSSDVQQGDSAIKFTLIWPVSPKSATSPVNSESTDKTGTQAKPPKHRRLIYRNLEEGIRQLPAYAQSLLRVQVPVTVTLATAKTPVSKVLAMGPGTILQFKKACDSNLTLEVGRQTVAEGEAVKVGDKFGLWITAITMPSERFWSVDKTATTKRVK